MTNENETTSWRGKHRRSYFGPILLIMIGLLFLAKNIGWIPGGGWDSLWRLWPVLLIVAGLDDLFRGQGVAWPILMIGAGISLLVNYYGPQTWVSWTQILQLWPILLIAVGIDIVFRGKSGWMSLVGAVLAILLLGGAVWLTTQRVEVAARYTHFKETYSSQTEAVGYDLSLDVGELVLDADAGRGILITGSLTPDNNLDELDLKAGMATYQLDSSRPAFFPYTARWELALTPDLPVDLKIHNGAGEMTIDLEGIDLQSLLANQGVGRMVVTLPENSEDAILIKQGVGIIRVLIPAGGRIAVDAQNGLSSVDFPAGFELDDGYYVTSGATSANADLLITVEQGVGLIDFEYER